MSNKNKWQALSMSERAFLIREAVRNGITDINSIRDTWEHRFDGESNQPTEDEYIAQRAKERIQKALTHARNRKETVVPLVKKGQSYKDREQGWLYTFESELDDLYKQADLSASISLTYDELGRPVISKSIKPSIQNRINELTEYINTYKLKCSQSHIHGPGCLATVMDDYGKTETWNERFSSNPGKLGFIEISQSDILPGDIVQFGNYYKNLDTNERVWDPEHAMMANTPYHEIPKAVKYNGSNGGEEVRINASYRVDSWEDNTRAYRFVGDKADSLQWKKEYREKYGHQFSGDEPNIFTDAWNAIKSSISQEDPESKITTDGPVDLDEIKRRQAWAESKFHSRAKSKAGAKGTFQIMDAVKADYIKAGGKDGDLYDPVYNEKVRDWLFTNLGTRQWVTKGDPSDSVKVGKQLAAYNAGPGPLLKGLNKAKAQGIDIYNSFDWVNTDYIPGETVDYVNWILRNKPTGVHRNDSVYNLNKHKYKKNKK